MSDSKIDKDKKEKFRPLEKRVYKFKNSKVNFFCPLCRSERALVYSYKLTAKNYIQIFMVTVFAMLFLYPVIEEKSFFVLVFFMAWGLLEFGVRLTYRRQIPCPYCGFDASWYKQDIKVARKLVHEFWGRDGDLGKSKTEVSSVNPKKG